MKRYVINGKFMSQKITGVQRFAIEVIKELDNLVENDQFSIVVPASVASELNLKKIKVIPISSASLGVIWTQLIIPFVAIKEKALPLTFSGIYPFLYPGVATIHDITPMRHKNSFKKRFYLGYDLMYRLSINRLKHIFTVSEFSKKEIAEYYKVSLDKITVVYNASNLRKSDGDKAEVLYKIGLEKGNYILSVGSLHTHKNSQFMYQLATRFPEMLFVIVGGSIDVTFEKIEKKHKKNLIYTGYLSDDELVEIYANARGFVFPSFYEGFGIPALEAIQLGVKHIAVSDIPVFREVYDVGVYTFDPYDVTKFDMDTFLDTEITIEQKSAYMTKYSWANSARRIMNEL